jgi:hypothetical protein
MGCSPVQWQADGNLAAKHRRVQLQPSAAALLSIAGVSVSIIDS